MKIRGKNALMSKRGSVKEDANKTKCDKQYSDPTFIKQHVKGKLAGKCQGKGQNENEDAL